MFSDWFVQQFACTRGRFLSGILHLVLWTMMSTISFCNRKSLTTRPESYFNLDQTRIQIGLGFFISNLFQIQVPINNENPTRNPRNHGFLLQSLCSLSKTAATTSSGSPTAFSLFNTVSSFSSISSSASSHPLLSDGYVIDRLFS